jgi:excisionase family DNA binding protein
MTASGQPGALRKNGLITAEDAAELLAVPKSWVLAEARANRIPHVRLGRYVRFEAGALEDWWASRRRGPWRSRGAAAGGRRVWAGCPRPGGRLAMRDRRQLDGACYQPGAPGAVPDGRNDRPGWLDPCPTCSRALPW